MEDHHRPHDHQAIPHDEPEFDIDAPVPPEFVDMPDDGRPGPVIKRMNQYRSEPVRWLEEGRIARGKLTLIAGDPGLGKSYMTLELAARVSRGDIGKAYSCGPGQSVIMSAEDDPGDTLLPRLNSMCARLANIHFIEGVRSLGSDIIDLPQLDRDTDRLIDSIRAIGDVSLVVIDPISAYMGRADSHNNAEVRCVLAQLSRLAQLTGAAVVCVTHLNKDSGGKRAIYRAMGSLAFTAAARTVHMVTKHPQSLRRVDRNHPDCDPLDAHGKRRTIRLGKINVKAAEAFKARLERLIASKLTGTPIDGQTAQWLSELPEGV